MKKYQGDAIAEVDDAYAALGELYGLRMQMSVMRKTIDAMETTQQHDEALLRQALETLEYHCKSKPGHEQPMSESMGGTG